MIAGIGTDLVEIYRIEEMILRGRHLSRIFTTTELAYAKDNATTLAGNFAVKEAVSKVFGTGFFGVEPYEIEVLRNESGAPYVKLYGKAKEIAKDKQTGKVVVKVNPKYYRPAEVDLLIGNPKKAKEVLGWEPKCTLEELCSMMVKEDLRRNEIGFSF